MNIERLILISLVGCAVSMFIAIGAFLSLVEYLIRIVQ